MVEEEPGQSFTAWLYAQWQSDPWFRSWLAFPLLRDIIQPCPKQAQNEPAISLPMALSALTTKDESGDAPPSSTG